MDMVGNLLATERKKKGLEIVDVEQATGIRSTYLIALEQGRYAALPGEVYVKGFIRNYGNYLGLDGSHLVHLYSDSVREIAPIAPPSDTAHKVNQKKQRLSKRQLANTLIVLLILLVSAWSLYSWQKSSTSSPSVNKPAAVSRSHGQPIVQTVPAAGGTTTSATAVVPSASKRRVVLAAVYSDRCWTSVIADGKSIYEGIPKIGESFIWEADQQIIVNFGNAAAVELTFNGQPVGKIGERGDVVVKTFLAPAVKP